MRVLLILAFCLVNISSAYASCDNHDCRSCVKISACSFAVEFNGEGKCVLQETLDTLNLKKIIFGDKACDDFYKYKRQPRVYPIKRSNFEGNKDGAMITVKPVITFTKETQDKGKVHGPSIRLIRPISAFITNSSFSTLQSVGRKEETSAPTTKNVTQGNSTSTLDLGVNARMSARSCDSYKEDEENLSRSLCRTFQLIGKKAKLSKLDRDLTMMNMLNPMGDKEDECKKLKWRKINCNNNSSKI